MNKRKLIIKDYVHNPKLELKEFLLLLLTKLNPVYNTLYADTRQVQCTYKKTRSLGDITYICKSYYPYLRRKKVKNCLLSFDEDLVGHYCSTIKKRVYGHRSMNPSWIQASSSGGREDEYGDKITYNNQV